MCPTLLRCSLSNDEYSLWLSKWRRGHSWQSRDRYTVVRVTIFLQPLHSKGPRERFSTQMIYHFMYKYIYICHRRRLYKDGPIVAIFDIEADWCPIPALFHIEYDQGPAFFTRPAGDASVEQSRCSCGWMNAAIRVSHDKFQLGCYHGNGSLAYGMPPLHTPPLCLITWEAKCTDTQWDFELLVSTPKRLSS